MAQRRITIGLPSSPEALHNVLQMLLQYDLISEKIARNIEHEEKLKKTGKKSRWAQAAEKMAKQGYLRGRAEEIVDSIQDFRDGFEIHDPFEKAAK